MCSERRREVEAGILLYLKDLAMQMVPADYANKRGESTICFILYIKYSLLRCKEDKDST